MAFLFAEAPENAQIIVGAETVFPGVNAQVIDVTWKKNQVLQEDAYERTLSYIEPFLKKATA